MLTFEEKQQIIESFPELTKRDVSMKRVNYHYEDSLYEKTTVVYHLHPNGNGYVYTGDLPEYEADSRGYVNIREFSPEELKAIIRDSINYLSTEIELYDNEWTSRDGVKVTLVNEDPFWNVYAGRNLEESFGTFDDAKRYLKEEGFREDKK
ncbi:hypothetical protein [Planococcus lenghuensis]|uniref:Uncharacterized protein n=1 Tax=Planococcus lenghuensis TaxID=2213202 RepID=A0A1Q2KUY6_9BACL|nr:hypothetical protein [Planococcus lenghuensis]AQQ52020.1 hypothetical protein B0X71_02035 [Planococcus lenghuensis]